MPASFDSSPAVNAGKSKNNHFRRARMIKNKAVPIAEKIKIIRAEETETDSEGSNFRIITYYFKNSKNELVANAALSLTPTDNVKPKKFLDKLWNAVDDLYHKHKPYDENEKCTDFGLVLWSMPKGHRPIEMQIRLLEDNSGKLYNEPPHSKLCGI